MLIPGAKGQKSDASLPAGGFLTLGAGRSEDVGARSAEQFGIGNRRNGGKRT